MYELKTLLPQFNIELPNNMYKMKNLNTTGGDFSSNEIPNGHISTTNKDSTITLRQDKILQQLNELKNQLTRMRNGLGLCQKGIQQHTTSKNTSKANTVHGNNGGLREEPLPDLVINGHPDFIPYALLALKNAWANIFEFDVRAHKHSTMPDIGPVARDFEQKLTSSSPQQLAGNETKKPKIKLTLIWMNCEHTEMISSPTMYVPIYGEVNIIRYLGRVGPQEYRYEDSPLCNEIDAVLDICYQLLRCTTSKGISTMLRALNSRLQNQKYFGGEQMSIADIGVHSSLKRMAAKITDKDLTPQLREWRQRAQLVTKL